jgi:DNA-binding response OmpR family regulator
MVETRDKVLLVDDDPDILIAVGAVLEAHNLQVITARDGSEALLKLREERPDLMILDLLMPKLDGFGVLKALKDRGFGGYADIPIVVLSSVRPDAARRRYELENAISFDVDDYVEKPIDPTVLLQRIRRFLKKNKETGQGVA